MVSLATTSMLPFIIGIFQLQGGDQGALTGMAAFALATAIRLGAASPRSPAGKSMKAHSLCVNQILVRRLSFSLRSNDTPLANRLEWHKLGRFQNEILCSGGQTQFSGQIGPGSTLVFARDQTDGGLNVAAGHF